MLSQLFIKNIAVIKQATIELSAGFNVFTGETGAGKTILVNAINGVLGARLTKDIIRSGEESAYISALFTEISPEIKQEIEQAGYEVEDDSILISRELGIDTKNTCKIGGRPATLSILRTIASTLIDIHGQNDNQKLLCPEEHIGYLDRYFDIFPDIEQYKNAYDLYKQCQADLNRLTSSDTQKLQRIDMLQFQISELESAFLDINEEEELLSQRKLIRNSEKVASLLTKAHTTISGTEETTGISELMDILVDSMTELASYLPDLAPVVSRFEGFSIDLADCMVDLAGFMEDTDYDPRQLDSIEDRLELLQKLKRKYGCEEVEGLVSYLETAREELDSIAFSQEKIELLEKKLPVLKQSALALAQEVTKKRMAAAEDFTKKVEGELGFLNMPNVKLFVEYEQKELSENGQDQIEFLISTNLGEPAKPLAKIASGGELSRIMLSIKNVFADKDKVGSCVFDEVDSGVSGQAAQKIGEKLREVSRNRQVICVTHLAQVAVYGEHHLKIEKKVEDGRTFTSIDLLEKEERVREIARIISGENITPLAIQNAQEMLQLA